MELYVFAVNSYIMIMTKIFLYNIFDHENSDITANITNYLGKQTLKTFQG